MVAAVRNHDGFVTPMAAVAGAVIVADRVLEALAPLLPVLTPATQ